MKILCVNAGSSSMKFQAYEMPEEKVLINGYIEKIGEQDCFYTIKVNGNKIKKEKYLKNHDEAASVIFDELLENNIVNSLDEIKGVGHRVLHGGEIYSESTVITDKVVEDIKSQWPTVYDDFYMNLEGEPKDANEMFDAAVSNATSNALGGATISKADALAMDDEVLYKRIKDVAMSRDFISKSYVQSSFNVGFNRAGRMINRLAEEGVISSIPEAGAKGFRVILKGTISSQDDSVNEGSSELVSERSIDDEE